MPDESLNAHNEPILRKFLVANVALFLTELVVVGLPMTDWATFRAVLATIAPWATVGPIVLTVLLASVPDAVTEFVVFARRTNRLPSFRSFTQLLPASKNAKEERLMRLLGIDKLPEDEGEQQRLWYRLYQWVESKPSVRDTNRRYLLVRNTTTLSLLSIATLLPVFAFVAHPPLAALLAYSAVLVVQLVVVAIATRSLGKRLASVVLSVASTLTQPPTS
jgi:hypothetical protein